VETCNLDEDNDGNNNNSNNELDLKFKSTKHRGVGPDSSVGITTRYGINGPGIQFRWGRDFLHPPRLALYNRYWVFLGAGGGGAARAWRWPPTPSSTEVKESVKLYIYSLSGPSWLVLLWPVPLPFFPSRSTEACAQFNHKNDKRGVLRYAVILITDLLTDKSQFLLYQL
jgi:hypothetical protein